MVEIIPAIMTESDEEFVRQIHLLERSGIKRVHLDISDGFFVRMKTILGHEQLRRITTNLQFDVHLMVQKPEKQCFRWCDISNASRFIVHVETTQLFPQLREQSLQLRKELVAALNPETPLSRLESVLPHVDMVQFMTIHPGAQGRTFLPQSLDRVTEFHAQQPEIPIMVDGGINPHAISQCVHAGATHVVSGSFVMRSADHMRALRELEEAVR